MGGHNRTVMTPAKQPFFASCSLKGHASKRANLCGMLAPFRQAPDVRRWRYSTEIVHERDAMVGFPPALSIDLRGSGIARCKCDWQLCPQR